MPVLLEVCVDSAEGLEAAVAGGAQRIELCSALDVGGLTPSKGLMALAAKMPVPVYAMIRPRAGDFIFDAASRDVMLADIDTARNSGLTGVVLGASLSDGRLDVDLLTLLVERSRGMGRTLHRAFDLVPDADEALEQVIGLGFERILTSGFAVKAADGMGVLRQLADQSAGRIAIMAGSGITPANVAHIVAGTGVAEVHASCRLPVTFVDEALVGFGFVARQQYRTSSVVVGEMRETLAAL
ncbi:MULTISPECIES: copper homeostasis protein CutC [Rhizobiaceae]|jgi:copper homeostasis protein|uniref:PF03932 family protein CutC n=1 Tax=Aliirhizobium cellulosilyticum TaxID=393664 RepID=A0A7W6Y2F9_9HYPH|nr:copper homeostasis protein CutC [Rhizobium cellulosilyticum]MBB4347298.1 copper homeostasis protein [Rhizobium cellulosilyticum]MBB4410308.1 copper homeostasis protein [Rhizobium cellulosilyticum]MBB4444995.1 copper homeostasis protein [Rhizobium cellulosilyticum]